MNKQFASLRRYGWRLTAATALLATLLILPIALLKADGITETTPKPDPKKKRQAKVQVALLLDTSGSMSGLIDQARAQLWQMVNELNTVSKNDQIPRIELSLYEYGNSRLSHEEGYIRQITPLTSDLDQVSEELFALSTSGGDEYCGQVIERAHDDLEWSDHGDDLKMIFIAGNEGFTQGPIGYAEICKKAIEKGIVVNTVFCGDNQSGVTLMWKDGADRAEGKYMSIDHNQAVVHIETPFDSQIQGLNDSLNATYIGFGVEGQRNIERQKVQDRNAANYGVSNIASRAASKVSANYLNTSWDLVDAFESNNDILDEVKKADLPENMRSMNRAEQIEYIETNRGSRADIRKEIVRLNDARTDFITQEKKKMGESNTLDNAMKNTIRDLANKNNFQVPTNK
ncbi:MAG: vWA domain-containing protein [Bacteroidota bacterium]